MKETGTILLLTAEMVTDISCQKTLEEHGYQVVLCSSGEQALDFLAKDRNRPVLALIDIEFGQGHSGCETAAALLEHHRLPVVFLSASAEKQILKLAGDIPHYGFVVKSTGEFVLLDTIRTAMRLFKPDEGAFPEPAASRFPARIQLALQESEDRFRITLENLPLGVYLHDLEGNIHMVNQAACQASGYTLVELLQMNVADIDPLALYREDRNTIWLKLQHEGYQLLETTHRHKNGSLFPVEVTISSLTLQGKRMLLGVAQDVTRRKQALEKLEYFKFAVDCSTNAIGMSTPQGQHWYQNEAFTNLFGEIGADPPARLYVEESIGREVFTTIMGGGTWSGEVEMYSQQRKVLNIFLRAYAIKNAEGTILGLVGVHLDITAQKSAEKNLRENEEILRLALEGAIADSWDMNLKTGELFFSVHWARYLGYEPGEIPCTIEGFQALVHPEDIANNTRKLKDHLYGKTPIYETETRLRRKDGSYIWLLSRGKTVERDASDKPLRLVGANFDITRMKTMEESIQKLLSEKKLLLKEVHHRIKNDMITIQSLLSLQALSTDNPQIANALTEAKNRILLMRSIYTSLYQGEDFQFINIQPFITDLLDSIKQTYTVSKKIGYHLDIAAIQIPAKQAFHIGIIVNELVTNAFKYAFGEKNAWLQVSLQQPQPGYLSIVVADNGNGLPEAARREDGHGFGLTLVSGLLQQHNGSMQIETKTGTCFRLTIPIEGSSSLP